MSTTPSVPEPPGKRGLVARWKARRLAREQKHAADVERQRQAEEMAAYHERLRAWEAQDEILQETLEAAQSFYGKDQSEVGPEWVLKKDEHAYMHIANVALIEPRRLPGHYQGGYSGVSIRVARGVSYRTGGSRGTFVPGPESPTVIDDGEALFTDQRIIFRGSKQSREWAYSKLLGYTPSLDRQWTAFQVSNRQKVSGIAYGAEIADLVEARLTLALATFEGNRADVVQHVKELVAQHAGQRPQAPPGLAAPPAT